MTNNLTEKFTAIVDSLREKEDVFKKIVEQTQDFSSIVIDYVAENIDHERAAMVAGIVASSVVGKRMATKISVGTTVANFTKGILAEAANNLQNADDYEEVDGDDVEVVDNDSKEDQPLEGKVIDFISKKVKEKVKK